MKRTILTAALLAMALMAVNGLAQEKKAGENATMKHTAAPNTPEWQQLRSLVGQWRGQVEEGGTKSETSLDIRLTGDSSAIMHWMAQGTPYEMVTMFHPDGSTLMATHYCSAHNQPRMQMVTAAKPNQLAFRFKDGTNIGRGDGHMVGLVITFIDADHHDEAWSYEDKGKELPAAVFHYTRKQ